jgi:hypothetical protein
MPSRSPRLKQVDLMSVSLETTVSKKIKDFAYHNEFSHSALIEFAVRELFKKRTEKAIVSAMREAGLGKRRSARI